MADDNAFREKAILRCHISGRWWRLIGCINRQITTKAGKGCFAFISWQNRITDTRHVSLIHQRRKQRNRLPRIGVIQHIVSGWRSEADQQRWCQFTFTGKIRRINVINTTLRYRCISLITNSGIGHNRRSNGNLLGTGDINLNLSRLITRRHDAEVIARLKTTGFKADFKSIDLYGIRKTAGQCSAADDFIVIQAFNTVGVIIRTGKFHLILTGG